MLERKKDGRKIEKEQIEREKEDKGQRIGQIKERGDIKKREKTEKETMRRERDKKEQKTEKKIEERGGAEGG